MYYFNSKRINYVILVNIILRARMLYIMLSKTELHLKITLRFHWWQKDRGTTIRDNLFVFAVGI